MSCAWRRTRKRPTPMRSSPDPAESLFRIGASADLRSPHSIHRLAFMRAIDLAWGDHVREIGRPLHLVLRDDAASVEGGRSAAAELIAKGVHCVVGHFASGAALSALALYQTHAIPVLLPAATADALTKTHDVAFRLCGTDSDLATAMAADIRDHPRLHALAIFNDRSTHGNAMTASLIDACARHDMKVLDDLAGADAIVFSGSFSNSVEFVHQIRHAGWSGPIFLTDDAVHSALPARLGSAARQVFAYGFAPACSRASAAALCRRYRELWGTDPETYFLETYAAMEIALAAAIRRQDTTLAHIANTTWDTVLGPLCFENGESRCRQYAVWAVEGDAISPIRSLTTH